MINLDERVTGKKHSCYHLSLLWEAFDIKSLASCLKAVDISLIKFRYRIKTDFKKGYYVLSLKLMVSLICWHSVPECWICSKVITTTKNELSLSNKLSVELFSCSFVGLWTFWQGCHRESSKGQDNLTTGVCCKLNLINDIVTDWVNIAI